MGLGTPSPFAMNFLLCITLKFTNTPLGQCVPTKGLIMKKIMINRVIYQHWK